MLTAATAAVAGLIVGRATGGRVSRVGEHPIRTWALLAAGAALQALAHVGGLQRVAFLMVVASYVALAAFAARNLHLVGMGLVLVAIVLNGVTIAVNHGMPVRAPAAEALGLRQLGPAHHLERGSDRLLVLADVIPLRITGEVLSFGDLVLAVGLADVVARVMQPRPSRSTLRGRRPSGRHALRSAVTH